MSRFGLTLAVALILTACGDSAPTDPPPTQPDIEAPEADPQQAWWDAMSRHCGQAFPGQLVVEPEGDEMLRGDEPLLVHFRQCDADTLRVPFHIETEPGVWDRSRTWVFFRTDDGRLELRHDHRTEDGAEDDNTWYGGITEDDGSPERQVFIYEEPAPDGSVRGWRVIIEPGERYVYGTFRGDDWRWRVDFDLSTPAAVPPAPWGYEGT